MRRYLLSAAAAFVIAGAGVALAQIGAPVGQTPGGAISSTNYAANNDAAGFNEDSITPAAVALATSTAQATFSQGLVATGQVLITRATVITTCSVTTGFTLPALQYYVPITVINRSGGSCLIWPSVGATVETALGTDGATNAPFTQLTNTDVIYRAITPTRWVQ
jgi:hypothetical protein